MSKVINIVGEGSNAGKTTVIEGIIKELKNRGYSIGTIKHDVHGFDIDKKGKDTYRHREAGSETVVISSKEYFAMIKKVHKEMELSDLLKHLSDKDIILVEGYKNSNLRKIEVFRDSYSKRIITSRDKLIAVASDVKVEVNNMLVVEKNDFKILADLIEKEEEYIF